MLKSTYIPGYGYKITDSRGRVVAHGLTQQQRDRLLQSVPNGASLIRTALLESL